MTNIKAVKILVKHRLLKTYLFYLNKIRPYLSHIIDEHKDGWKIQLVAEITSSSVDEKDSEEFYPIYIHSDNSKVHIGSEQVWLLMIFLKVFWMNISFL